MSRVLISINAAWNVVNFRAGLVRALVADGHEVIAAVVDDGAIAGVTALGARPIAIPMASRSTSIGKDAALFARYLRLMRRERPDVYLGWTIKPNTYGSAAAALLGVPVVNNISGLGTAFIRSSWLTRIAKALYRVGLARSSTVFFQNYDDRDLFVKQRLVRPEQTELLPGSGIDVDRFDPAAFPAEPDGLFRFLLIARLVRDKGVVEYVEAARMLRARFPHTRFEILGFLDVDNRTAIPRTEFDAWVADDSIAYLGAAEDVRPHIARADCIVLPSYREGTSRVLLEAAAMAKPSVTTDVPGCRDVVIDGETGLLCAPRDASDLARKMTAMLDMPESARAVMGRAARARAAAHFSEQYVIERYRMAIARAIAPKRLL